MQVDRKVPIWEHLGIVAGGGLLPLILAREASTNGKAVNVACFHEFTDQNWDGFQTRNFTPEEIAPILSYFQETGVDTVVFGGQVSRPDFGVYNPEGLKPLDRSGLLAAARQGDDPLLRSIITLFEGSGFTVLGTADIAPKHMMPMGYISNCKVPEYALDDARFASEIAQKIGALDIGQGAVVCDGVVLAVEAQEGTARMLARCAELPTELRGTKEHRRGVFAKTAKPGQDRRIDLPVLGVSTIEDVAHAGLAGLVLEAGAVILLEVEAIKEAADRLGLFILGVEAD